MGTVIPFPRSSTVPAAAPEPARSHPDGRRRRLWRELVGAYLRQVRTEQERILAEVAGVAGVSTQYLSEIERGRKEPSSEILGAVADALGLDLADVARGVTGIIRRDESEEERRRRALGRPAGPARRPAPGALPPHPAERPPAPGAGDDASAPATSPRAHDGLTRPEVRLAA